MPSLNETTESVRVLLMASAFCSHAPLSWKRTATLISVLLGAIRCGGAPAPIEYPEIKVHTSSFEMNIRDERRTLYTTVTEASESYERGGETFAQRLPESFENAAVERLGRLRSGEGLALRVAVLVKRADVTFLNEPRGKFARYDVTLAFRVTTERGTLLEKGEGASWQEVPEREFSEATLAGVFADTALEAFDRYFASENTLNKLNRQIGAYKRAHPDDL